MPNQSPADLEEQGEAQLGTADPVGQGELEQITDRDPQPLFSVVLKKKFIAVGSVRTVRTRFVGQQIVAQCCVCIGGE